MYSPDWSIIYWSHVLLEFIAALELSFQLSCWIFRIPTSHYSFDRWSHWQQLFLTNKHLLVREILKAGYVFLNFSFKSREFNLWLINFLMKFTIYAKKKKKFSDIKYLLQTPNVFVFGLTSWCASENFWLLSTAVSLSLPEIDQSMVGGLGFVGGGGTKRFWVQGSQNF